MTDAMPITTIDYPVETLGFTLRVRFDRFKEWETAGPILKDGTRVGHVLDGWARRWASRQSSDTVLADPRIRIDDASFHVALGTYLEAGDEQSRLRMPRVKLIFTCRGVRNVKPEHRPAVESCILRSTVVHVPVLNFDPSLLGVF